MHTVSILPQMRSSQCPSSFSTHANRSGTAAKAASVCLERPTVAPPRRQQSHLPRQQQHQQEQEQQQQLQQQHEHACDTHQTYVEFEYTHQLECKHQPKGFDGPKGSVAGRRRRRPTSSNRSSSAASTSSSSSGSSNSISSTYNPSVSDSTISSTSNTARGQRQWTPLHSKLLQSLRREQVLPRHARVLVGVSGGQDSMAMLRLLYDLSRQQHWPLRLVVGHCDHKVRPDSADNAAFVQQYCEELGLPYMQAVADRQIGHWAEAPARTWRQQQLARMASEACCEYLALGHTATERAETVLFNMIRGAGLRGVGAMGWSRPLRPGLQLVRPLLDFSRPETLQACELTDTEIYPDTTNSDPRYVRNRLRLSVFPLLQELNASAVHHICSAAEIARVEGQLLEMLAWQKLATVAEQCHVASGSALKAAEQDGQPGQHMQQQSEQQGKQQGKQHCNKQHPQQGQQQGKQQCEQQEGTIEGHMQQPWCAGAFRAQAAVSDTVHSAVGQLLQQQLLTQRPVYVVPSLADVLAGRRIPLQQQHEHRQSQHSTQQRPIQPQHEQSEPSRTSVGECVQGLSVSGLNNLHPALQRRVVHLWLSQQTKKSVSSLHVAEVLQLLKAGQGTGARTSTLWGSSCVLRYKQLLLVLDAESVQKVLAGVLRVQQSAGMAAGMASGVMEQLHGVHAACSLQAGQAAVRL